MVKKSKSRKKSHKRAKSYNKPYKKNDAMVLGWTLIIISVVCFLSTGLYGYTIFYAVSIADDYSGEVSIGPHAGVIGDDEYNLDVSIGDAVIGVSKLRNYKVELGTLSYLGRDGMPPILVEQSVSTYIPKAGEKVEFIAKWEDDSPPITVDFWNSHSDTWVAGEPQKVASLEDAKYEFDTAGIDGSVKLKTRASDAYGNTKTEAEVEITIGGVDNEPPKISDVYHGYGGIYEVGPGITGISQSTDNPRQGEIISLVVEATDNYGLKEAIFEVKSQKQNPVAMIGREDSAVLNYDTSELAVGERVTWKVYVLDGSNFKTESKEKTFTVEPPLAAAEKCADGTEYGRCSSNKPKYCEAGDLVDKCSECGCPEGFECIDEGCEEVGEGVSIFWISLGLIAAIVAGIAGVLLLRKKQRTQKKAITPGAKKEEKTLITGLLKESIEKKEVKKPITRPPKPVNDTKNKENKKKNNI